MNVKELISECYIQYSANIPDGIEALPGSGSDRKYYRITDSKLNLIAVYNENREENDAFVELSRIFLNNGLPVPEVFRYFPEQDLYFQSDLGDTNLYTWIKLLDERQDSEQMLISMYKQVLENLVDFQIKTIRDIDLDICYPHRSFDRQSIMWDMNYFKYMFLKLLTVPFNEKRLEKDFSVLAENLLEAGQDYFLYRDFQSANIMIYDSSPWFIDFQGGRAGAPQYDVASLLYDSKANISNESRNILLDHYLNKFSTETEYSIGKFREHYPAFVLVRIMQAMGAYGYRGIFQKKAGFATSIAPAVRDLENIINSSSLSDSLPEIFSISRRLLTMIDIFEDMK